MARLWRYQVSYGAPLALSGFILRAFGAVTFHIPRLALSSHFFAKPMVTVSSTTPML
jgi:hypothetical protein